MYQTGIDLQSAYRETARGGLAALWKKRMASQGAAASKTIPTGTPCD
jgi:hypothetical protein